MPREFDESAIPGPEALLLDRLFPLNSPQPTPASLSPQRRALSGMSYEDGASYLSPTEETEPKPKPKPKPKYGEAATESLNQQMDDEQYKLEITCFMDTTNRLLKTLSHYRSKLMAYTEPTTDGQSAADACELNSCEHLGDEGARHKEIALINQMTSYLQYSLNLGWQDYTDGPWNYRLNRDKSVKKADAEQAAFPGLSPREAKSEAKRLYRIASSQVGGLRRTPTPFRAAGVGGAMATMGGAEIVYQDEILAGKLKPGATLQYWNDQNVHLKSGKTTFLKGKEVYQAMVGDQVSRKDAYGSGQRIGGHSITFLKYGETTSTIHTLDYGGTNETEWSDFANGSSYFVGANISTDGSAQSAAEFVLQDTKFQADAGKDLLQKMGAKYQLDPKKLASAMLEQINASGHADLAKIQASLSHHGISSTFDHDMARLVGLWQHAVGATVVDGKFGGGSCKRLTGTSFDKASSIKVGELDNITPEATTGSE